MTEHIDNEENFRRAAKYVAMQCTDCPDSLRILEMKAIEVMKSAVERGKNPYKALNEFLGTNLPEEMLIEV